MPGAKGIAMLREYFRLKAALLSRSDPVVVNHWLAVPLAYSTRLFFCLEGVMNKKHGFTIGVIRSDGWIDPEGVFFPCEAWAHDFAARQLANKVYGLVYGNSDNLLEKGWVRCGPPHLRHNGSITELQLSVAREVSVIMQNEFVKQKFIKNIEKEENRIYGIQI